MEEIDVREAGRFAAGILKEIHGIDASVYTSAELSDVINCLFAVRRAKTLKNLGLG